MTRWWFRRGTWFVYTNGQLLCGAVAGLVAAYMIITADEHTFRMLMAIYFAFKAANHVSDMVRGDE